MSEEKKPPRSPQFADTQRVRLLVEADVPVVEYFRLVIEHDLDLNAVYRALVPKMVTEFNATIKEPKRRSRRKGEKVVLQLPDGTKMRVSPTGRPPGTVQDWKRRGYVIDWETETMILAPEPAGGKSAP